MGRLIVFEGIDGSGKSTQFKLLCDRLEMEGVSFRRLTFPRYSEPSSALIKMYLDGQFGENPADINPYAASTFFAVDRFASYVQEWREYYGSGGLLLTDRYTTSNAIHQGAKLSPEERPDFFKWLYDFEFRLMGLPAPDAVIYLEVPMEISLRRIHSRETKTGNNADIHEKDIDYLLACRECGDQASRLYGWNTVACLKNGVERVKNEKHEEIYSLVLNRLL